MNPMIRACRILTAGLLMLTVSLGTGCQKQGVTAAPDASVRKVAATPLPLLEDDFYKRSGSEAEREAEILEAFLENRRRMMERDFAQAVLVMRQLLQEYPDAHEMYAYLFESYGVLLRFLVREPSNPLWKDAVAWYERAARELPEAYRERVKNLGSETVTFFIEAKRNADAVRMFKVLLKLGAEELPVRMSRGQLYLIMEQYDQAIEELEAAFALERDRLMSSPREQIREETLELIAELTEAYAAQQDMDAIDDLMNRARELDPSSTRLQRLEAYVRGRRGDVERSEELYRGLLENTETENPEEVKIELARLLGGQERYEEMEELLLDAMNDATVASEAAELLVDYYVRTGQYDAAESIVDRISRLYPTDEIRLALFYSLSVARKEEYDRALPYLRTYARRGVENKLVYQTLFEIYRAQQNFEEALDVAMRAQGTFPLDPIGCGMESTIHLIEERYQVILEDMIDCYEAFPEDFRLTFNRGVAFFETGDFDAFERIFLGLIAMQPRNAGVLNYLGYSYADKGIKLDKAEEFIRRALAIEPNNGAYIDSMGWVLYRRGQYEEAVTYLRRAAELMPEDPIIHDHLGDAYYRLREIDQAVAQWEQALTLAEEDANELRDVLRRKIEARTIPEEIGD